MKTKARNTGKAKASRRRSRVKDLSAKHARPLTGGRLIGVYMNYEKFKYE